MWIATPERWKRLPFMDVTELPYHAVFTDSEYMRMSFGAIPEVMEDKWFIYMEQSTLFLHDSWTGGPCFRVRLERDSNQWAVVSAVRDQRYMAGESDAYCACLLNFLIRSILLREELDFPRPQTAIGPTDVVQHSIAGRSLNAARPRSLFGRLVAWISQMT